VSNFAEFFPHHPKYSFDSSPSFSNCYQLAHSILCPTQGHRPPAVILDRGSPRTCALCGGTEENTTFEEVAHTLPASFGNRHHTTNEECDQCNLQFGKEYEQNFALWLNPERTFNRVRRRPNEAPPVLRGPNGTSVEVDGVTGSLVLKLDSKQIDQINKSENSEITFSYIRPACNQVSALRSILKTAWLLLKPDERSQHPILLKLIKKEISLPRWECWELVLPGNGFAFVQFEVWRRLASASTTIAPLVIRFTIGNIVILWVEPNEVSGEQLPSPFPPLRIQTFEEGNHTLTARLHEITEDKIFPEKEEEISFSYKTITKGPAKLPPRPAPKPIQSKLDMRFVHEVHDKIELDVTCHIRVVDQNNMRLFISGGDLAATIVIKSNSLEEESTANIRLNFDNASALSIQKTLVFFRSLQQNGERVVLRNLDGAEWFVLAGFFGKSPVRIPNIDHIIQDILTINKELGVDIKYSESATNEDFSDLSLLANAIRTNGVVEQNFLGRTLTFNGNKKAALNLIDIFEKEGESEFLYSTPVIYNLWDNELPVLDKKIIIPKASVKVPLAQLREEFLTASDKTIVRVPLIGEKILYEFPRWKK